MEREELRILLEKVESGQQTAADALSDISLQPDMLVGNYADIDLHRHMRQGMPEVIYGAGKTAEQIVGIASAMKQKGLKNILITRLSEEKADEIAKALEFSYYSTPQIGIVNEAKTEKRGKIVVVTAGTSDLPVAEEAAMTAELYGNQVERVYDVGVAGIHRLFARLDAIQDANCVVAVAGMEGALASVLGGLVNKPVIAVPTSVGYGASMNGISALLTMINSCANGIATVNIDNGYGAGYIATQINRMGVKEK